MHAQTIVAINSQRQHNPPSQQTNLREFHQQNLGNFPQQNPRSNRGGNNSGGGSGTGRGNGYGGDGGRGNSGGNRSNANPGTRNCHHCNSPDRFVRDCPHRQRGPPNNSNRVVHVTLRLETATEVTQRALLDILPRPVAAVRVNTPTQRQPDADYMQTTCSAYSLGPPRAQFSPQ